MSESVYTYIYTHTYLYISLKLSICILIYDRVKFDFDTKTASSTKAIELSDVVRVEYGSFKAAKTSLTTWVSLNRASIEP